MIFSDTNSLASIEEYLRTRTWVYDHRTSSFYDKATKTKLSFTFNPDDDTFMTSTGVTLKISPLSTPLIMEYQDGLRRELLPQMPTKKIRYGDGTNDFEEVGDPDSPDYRAAINTFMSVFSVKIMKYILYCSIDNPLPAPNTYSRKLRALLKNHEATSEEDILYCWVYSMMQSDAETEAMTIICQGRSLVTEESIALVERIFRGEDISNGHISEGIPDKT